MPKQFYQHDDEVIEAARHLMDMLLRDSPFGNEDAAREWARSVAPDAALIADQKTEGEENVAA